MSDKTAAQFAEQVAGNYICIHSCELAIVALSLGFGKTPRECDAFAAGCKAGAAAMLAGVVSGEVNITEIRIELKG